MQTILLVGQDAMLLQTRASVLRRIGVMVVDAPAASALSRQAELQADLVVICHSVSLQQTDLLIQAIRCRWPATRILRVSALSEWSYADTSLAVDGVSSCEPAKLIRIATALLQQVPSASSRNLASLSAAASLS